MPRNCAKTFVNIARRGGLLLACAAAAMPGLVFAQAPTPSPQATAASPSNAILSVLQNQSSAPSGSGAAVPAPPPPSGLSMDANQLAAQAEQTALQAQAQAEAEAAKRDQEYDLKSFNRAERGMLPLSPDQIRDFMHRLEETQDASVSPYAGPPKGQVRIETLSLDPGVEPPQINLAAGYVTTINIVDATGAPWPILDVGVGGNFEVTPTQAGSHVVRVMPLARVSNGNLSILLKDLSTPVIFRLASGGPSVDLRYDARIPKLSANAKVPLISHPPLEAGGGASDDGIMMILENAPPGGAKRMKIAGLDARSAAWLLNNHVYVRTPLTLLSPAWDASVSSTDGMTVYEIGDAPVLLMSDNGAIVRATLSRDDDHDK